MNTENIIILNLSEFDVDNIGDDISSIISDFSCPLNKDVEYLIVPYDSLGSGAVLSSIKNQIKVSNSGNIKDNRQELVNQMNFMQSQKEGVLNNVGKQETIINRAKDGNFNPNDKSTWGRVGRNDLCPCGSGKKYKQCCGKIE